MFLPKIGLGLLAWMFVAIGPRTSWSAPSSTIAAGQQLIATHSSAPRAGGWAAAANVTAVRISERLTALASTPAIDLRPRAAAWPAALLQGLRALAERLDAQRTGIFVRDLQTGESVFSQCEDCALNPASNHKLLVGTAALDLLGADFRFHTRVVRRGDTLVLIGDGDPSLQVADLSALARQTAAATDLAGVRRLVVDDSAFSERRFGPGYDEGGPGLSYMAPSGALSLQFNTIEITVQRTELGRPLAVSVSPACDHVEIVSTAVTGRGHLSVTTSQRDGRTVVRVAGGTRAKVQRFRRRIYDPGMFTASVFARALSRASGIEVLPVERGVADGNQELVAVHRSAPLAEVLESTLKFSNNFTAEQLVRTLGRHMSDRPGDWSNGLEALRRYSQALSLVDRDSLRFENASGLSATGRATARSLVDLLTHAARSERDVHELLEALPVAGREGTLHHRLHGTGGRVRAKTGTLADALALSGVVYDRHGRPRWGFSILVNAAKDRGRARKIQDAMVRLLVEHSDTLAGRG